MTTVQPAAVMRQAREPGGPLSLDEAAALLSGDARRASQALTHLVARGDFVKVRQRLWVRAGSPASAYRLGARITAPYAFAYGTALALHGGAAAEGTEILVSSPHRFEVFEFEGVLYRPARPWFDDGLAKVTVGPEFVWSTNPERTLVECVRVPANAGGMVEILRGAGGLPQLRPIEVLRWLDRYGESNLAARLGFVLESLDRPQEELPLLAQLERRRPSSRVYLERGRRGGRLVSRWNLIVPREMLATRGGMA